VHRARVQRVPGQPLRPREDLPHGQVPRGQPLDRLQGAATLTSLSGDFGLLATLPAVIRPGRTVYTIVHTFDGTYADLAIQPSGQVQLIDPRPPMGGGDTFDYTFVSLEGVTYLP
jgi:hypothetical protein